MAHPFLDRIAQGPILGDGAMGTQLYAHGIGLEECFDAVNLDNLDLVRTIHRDYINAGADLIETNTYGANRLKLERFGLGDKVFEINKRALRAARDAREISGQAILIAGAVGPLGAVLEPYGNLKSDKAREVFREQIAVLLEQGADLLMFETFGDLRELLIAIDAARSIGDLPIVAQMSFADDGRTVMGNTPEEVVQALVARDVAMVGVNCSVGPQRVFKVLEAMHVTEPKARLSAQPNAGWSTLR